MSYREHFRYYGSGNDTCQRQMWILFYKPESIYDLSYIQQRDKYAADDIKKLESMIEDLKEYRQDLAKRYAELATTTYTYKLYLVRDKSWSTNKVSYTVRLARVLPDGKEIDEQKEVFAGTERKKAFELFAQIKKERPGIEAIQDTDKKQWER